MLRTLASVAVFAAAAPTFAAQRTFVASHGIDSNPCSLVQPCRSFSAAIAKTADKGEVLVLDSAGYGPVSITQSVSIIAPAGVYAGISVSNDGDGVSVHADGIAVVLRGLTINGDGTGIGVNFYQGARLAVEDCEISNMGTAVTADAANSVVSAKNTVLRDSGHGFYAVGPTTAVLDGVHSDHNYSGVDIADGARVTIANSVISNSTTDGVFVGSAAGGYTDATVTHSVIRQADHGFRVAALNGSIGRIVSDSNAIDQVGLAFYFQNDGGTELVYTAGNNTVAFNNGIASGGSLSTCCVH